LFDIPARELWANALISLKEAIVEASAAFSCHSGVDVFRNSSRWMSLFCIDRSGYATCDNIGSFRVNPDGLTSAVFLLL